MTRNRIPGLSKSRFMSGLQCHKRLYLELYEPALAEQGDDRTQSLIDQGQKVGALARNRYPGGRLIEHDYLHHSDAELTTRSALSDRAIPAVYEGAFSFDRVAVRADILTKTRDSRVDLFEVKSGLDVKDEHQWDVAVQLYVLEGAGVPVRQALLTHLNRGYIYPGGDYDLKQLFTSTDIGEAARGKRGDLIDALRVMREVLAAKAPPAIATGPQCEKPYHCPFSEHCHQGAPEHSMEDLPRLGARLREQLQSPWAFLIFGKSRQALGVCPRYRPESCKQSNPAASSMIQRSLENWPKQNSRYILSISKPICRRCRFIPARIRTR